MKLPSWTENLAGWLLAIGGINWLLTAFEFNVVNKLFGGVPTLEMLTYVIIGLAGIYWIVRKFKLL